MSGLGTVVVAGRTLTVTGLALAEGKLIITATIWAIRSPWPAITNQPAAVFGPDNQPVCRGWLVSIPHVPAGKNVIMTLPLEITITKSQPTGKDE